MRFPTGHEVQRLRSDERNFSRVFLGVQRGKELGDYSAGTLMVGQHYQLVAADGYVAAEHLLYFSAVSLVGTDVRPNMSLLCGTATDPSAYGSVRVRAIGLGAGPGGTDGLYLEPNNLRVPDGRLIVGDYIWVDGVYRLYRKLPYIRAGTVFEDGNANSAGGVGPGGGGIPGYGLPFTDGVSGNPDYMDRPIALMGSPRFAWTGENVDFYGWRSHGRGGNTIQNWTWDFDGGVGISPGIGYPGSPGHPVHVRWDSAGEYIASLVVEDNSGKVQIDDYGVPYDSHRAVRPVLVYDRPGEGDNVPYSEFKVESLTGKYGSGWSCRITVFGTADRTEFPDNALIIVYAEDRYGDQGGSIGGWYGQENILFCGYIRSDSVAADFEKSTVSFEAQTIERWMKDISVWPVNCVSTAGAPTRWHEFQAMTVEDVLWYLTEFRSNLKDITDCFFASDVGAEKLLGFVDLTEASLYDQMSAQLGSCFFGQLSGSRHGSIHLFKHKNMMDLGERVWWGPPVYSFSKQDWRDEIQIGEERMRDSVAQVDFTGFVYTTTGRPLEVYSLAPARQTNFGKIETVSGVLLSGNSIVAGQAENNTLAGLYLAWKNIRFPHITVPTRVNNRVLECATQDYFAVTLTAADTARGFVWPSKEFLTTGISVKIDNEHGIISVDVEGEASTWGPDGVAGEYPAGPPADPPADNPSEYWASWPPGATPENPDGDPPPWAAGDEYLPAMAYLVLRDRGYVVRVENALSPDSTAPVYTPLNLTANRPADFANGLYWIALDEFDPENRAMVAGTDGVWSTQNLSDDNPTWTLEIALPAGWNRFSMVRSSPVQDGVWMAVANDYNVDLGTWWTVNDGENWNSDQTLATGKGRVGGEGFTYLELSSHDVNVAWVNWPERPTDGGDICISRTTNMWTTNTLQVVDPTCLRMDGGQPNKYIPSHHRYTNNPADLIGLFGGAYSIGTPIYTRLAFDTDGNVAGLLGCHTVCSDITHSQMQVRDVGCHREFENRWWALVTCRSTGVRFEISDDGITWTNEYAWIRDLTVPGQRDLLGIADWRHDGDTLFITEDGDGVDYGPLWVTRDRGVTFSRQPGNWNEICVAQGWVDGSEPNIHCVAPI